MGLGPKWLGVNPDQEGFLQIVEAAILFLQQCFTRDES